MAKGKKTTEVDFKREIFLWVVVAISLLLFISNFGIGGKVGGFISGILFGLFGMIAYIFPLLLMGGCFFGISNKGNVEAVIKLVAAVMFAFFLCMFLNLILYSSDYISPGKAFIESRDNKSGGGFVGGLLCWIFVPAIGVVGSYIVDFLILIISMVLITEKSFMTFFKKGGKKVYEQARETTNNRINNREVKDNNKDKRTDRKFLGVSLDTKLKKASDISSDDMGEIHIENYPDLPEIKEETITPLTSGEITFSGNYIKENELEEPPIKERKRRSRSSEDEIQTSVVEVKEEIVSEVEHNMPAKEYVFPPKDLLKYSKGSKGGTSEKQLRETAQKLENTLNMFGVGAKVTNISCGPTVTRYEVQPEVGVKVSKIVNLADDLKLNLEAADIRIEAPIPGKPAVGIEVPNAENTVVGFRELIESREFESNKSKIAFAAGKDIGGQVIVSDIAKMPHLLIAGATGSGKSVCINTIIMSILYKAKPEDVKLIMIDPKVVELSVYNGIPHLLIPVVTDAKKAAGALAWAVSEMMERYEKFAGAGVRDFAGYNKLSPDSKLPLLVIIVDELADLMMVASKEVEEHICRLAQLARAAGIHLIIATQRPSVNVITGLIKANMPSRIAFSVTSGIDSRTILDMNGAEKLLGKGDMLYDPQGAPKPLRVQGAFVSDDEVAKVVNFIKANNFESQADESVMAKLETMQSSNTNVSIADDNAPDDGRDAYFFEAANIIVDKEKASIGMLQRYLKIGFNRAARIMDQLEEAGVVGPELGTKPRTVLMTPEDLQTFIDESE